MSLRYLIDESMPPLWRQLLLKQEPALTVYRIDDPGQPASGTLDPDILIWCERSDLVLITNNRKTMPGHLKDHLAAGRHVPGIFTLPTTYRVLEIIDNLILVAGASLPDEFKDQIQMLPIQ